MKKVMTILLATACISACSPSNNGPTPQPANPGGGITNVAASHWIPNWANDTLVGIGNNPNATQPQDNYDIIYSYTRHDTSLIKYHGTEYYIWTQCPYSNPNNYPDWFTDDNNVYSWVYIGTRPFDTTSSITSKSLIGISPSKYYDSDYGTWHTQYQVIMVSQPPFPEWVNSGFYTTEYKEYLH